MNAFGGAVTAIAKESSAASVREVEGSHEADRGSTQRPWTTPKADQAAQITNPLPDLFTLLGQPGGDQADDRADGERGAVGQPSRNAAPARPLCQQIAANNSSGPLEDVQHRLPTSDL